MSGPGIREDKRWIRFCWIFVLLVGAASPGTGCGIGNQTCGTACVGTVATGSQGISQIIAWGDSLTAGNEDGTGITYPNQLQKLIGLPVTNLGIGGQTSSQIAVRMNAYAGENEQTFASGFTLPTSGTVMISFQTGFEPSRNVGTGTGTYYNSGIPIQFTVSGVTYQGKVTSSGSTYTFTPTNYPTSSITVPSGTSWMAILPDSAMKGCQLIWAGRNNESDGPQVESDIAAMVAVAKANSGCYLVMSILNGELDGPKGTTAYYWAINTNNDLAAAYPGHYIDIRADLVASYNPANAADVLDHNNDIPPYSLRAQDINGTLSVAVTSTTTCAITFGGNIPGAANIVTIGSEEIYVTGGSNGAWSCARGYAGTTASTYSTGQIYTGVDALHLGQNLTSSANPIGDQNGYDVVAAKVAIWLNGLTSP